MLVEFIWLGLAIAAAGYFIGDGLKNFNNPNAKDHLSDFFDDDDEPELIKESDVHHFMGISKEDAKNLLLEYPDIPHVFINNNVYYPKLKLRKWLTEQLGGR
ncbi:hypothetical protein NCCP2716_27090 [Sporosarcina sp. NCCP-2716]|uniref:DNA-binding protein n=1 Tax=Sporosarcina sp. NCCP-2716 TaxID=2943679 RepID=UPI00203E4182|nr:DNA-binding protein [Sporosarcina sp. NCCP-2716]GKV70211.1 hypothetical protein NCCP2716_27090 [Sporosarcina sp. NCCP-2716]